MSLFFCTILTIQTAFTAAQSHNFIFDFNGVLMGTNKVKCLKNMGLSSIARCMFFLKKGLFSIDEHIRATFFNILEQSADVHGFDKHKSQPAYDEHGNLLPYFMRAWLDGSMTCAQIQNYCFNAIELHEEWFEHSIEKQIIISLIKAIFTPESFVETRTIHKECLRYIKTCKKHGHKIFALSNWDTESFALLQKKYPHVFNLFDGIIISGDVHCLKPSGDIYTTLLTRYDLSPKTCWFIDDQQENVNAACQLGINGIRCYAKKFSQKPDFHRVMRDIKQTVTAQHCAASCGTTMAANLSP